MPRVTFNRKPLGAVAAFIITLVVYAGYRAGNSSSAAALDSTVGMNAKTEPPVLYKQDDLQQHHPIVPALPTPPPALAPEERTQQSQPLTYVLSRLVSACELPSVPISSLHECAVAGKNLKLHGKPILRIDAHLLPSGCFYKSGKLETYYQNFYNHSDKFYDAHEQRLFWNIGGVALKTEAEAATADAALDAKVKAEGDKKHPYKMKRLAVCKRQGVCPRDRQKQTCSDWMMRAAGPLQPSCTKLEQWGLSCNGCRGCGPEYVHHDAAGDPQQQQYHHQQRQEAVHANGPRARSGATNNNSNNSIHQHRASAQHGLYSANANLPGHLQPSVVDARVVCTGAHGTVVPPGDVFVYVGEYPGYEQRQSAAAADGHRVAAELVAFNQWLTSLPHRQKFLVLGETEGERDGTRVGGRLRAQVLKYVTNAKVLMETREPIDVDGDGAPELTIWGGHSLPQDARLRDAPADIIVTWEKGDPNVPDGGGRTGKKPRLHCFSTSSGKRGWVGVEVKATGVDSVVKPVPVAVVDLAVQI